MAYTNSKLASYRNITKNQTPGRRDPIDIITIHCVVGQCTARSCVDYFYNTNRKASSNYVVGYDGSVGISVDEKDIAWTSNSFANDKRAVTIEVASDTFHPYAVTDAAYNKTIELCADICRRNGKTKALWITADKQSNNIWTQGQLDKRAAFSYKLKPNEMLFTVHRWYSAQKSCPGDYLHNRMGDIVAKVNRLLSTGSVRLPEGSDKETPNKPTPGKNKPSLVPGVVSYDEETIYKYLSKKELPLAAICGIMSNMYHESGYISNNLQNSYEDILGHTDEAYTKAVDNGSYTNFVYDRAGYGLIQWTFWSIKKELLDYAKKKRKSIGDYKVQCDVLYKQLKRNKKLWHILSTAQDTEQAAYTCGYRFCYDFERPANKAAQSQIRGNYAKELFNKYRESNNNKPTSKPKEPKQDNNKLYDALHVGDIYQYVGSYQYRSSNSDKPVAANYNGYVEIIQKQNPKSKHPILARSVNDKGKYISSVYGWIDVVDLEDLPQPFLVKVTADVLNIRSGPGTSYRINGTIEDKGTYTIVEEHDGWGKLKSGAGWISLYYTRKV